MADNSQSNITPQTGGFNPTTKGVSPAGVVPIPVAGMAALTTSPLAANAVWSSGIIYYNGTTAVDYQIVSDVPGAFSVVYYDANGNQLPFVPANVPYDPTIVKSFGSAFNAKGYGFSFTYTNGSTAQTQFLIAIGLSNNVQPTQQSAVTAITDTNLALVSKVTHQAKENATGSRKELTGTATGSKFGLDVNVVNPSSATDVSALATSANQTNGQNKVQIVNGNNQTYGSQATPFNVAVSNFPATQPVSGTVNANVTFPTTQQVSVSNFPANTEISNDVGNPIPVSGTVAISNPVNTVSVSNFPATQPVSGTVTISNPTAATDVSTLAKESGGNLASILTQLQAINADQGTPSDAAATSVTGSQSEISLLKAIFNLLTNLQQRPATGTTVSNTTLATTTTVLAANPLRKGATMFSVTGTILVLLGSGASATVFTARLITNGYYEVPFGYTGIITAIGAGTLLVTELT